MEKKSQEFKESVGFSRVESGVSSSELPDLPPPWEVGKLTTIVKFPFDDETNQHLQMESAFACSNHTSAIVVVVDSKRKIRVLGWLDVFQPLRPRYIALKILDRGIVAAHSVIIPTLGQDATSKINQNVALSTDNRNEYFLHVEYAQRHLDSDQVHSRTETVCVDFFIRRRNERNIFTFLPSLERSVELSAVKDKDKDKESESEEKKSSTLGVQIKREFGTSSAVEENEIVTKAFSILPENQHLFTFSDSGSLVIKAGKSMTKFDKHNTTNSSLATQLDLSRQLDSLLHVYRTPEQFQDSLNSSLVGGIGGTGVVSHHGGLCKVIFDKIPKADYSGALTATFSLSQVDGESEVYSKSYPQRIDLSQQALKHVKCDDDIVVYTTKLNGDAKQNSGKTEGGKFLCHTENATPTANENQWHALPVPVNERLESEPRKIIGETLELILHSTHYIDMKTETKTRVKTAIRIYRNAIIINALNSVKSPNFNLLSTGFQGTRMGTVILIDILKFQNLTPTQLQITLHSMVLATTWLFLTRTPLKDDLLTSSPENAKATMERLWTSWFKVMMKNIPLADLANGVELSPFRGAWLDAKKKYSSEWSATVWDSFRVELGDIFALLEQMALPETVQLLRQYLAFPQAQIMSWNLNSNLELLDMSKFLMNTSHQQVTALVQTAFSWRIQLIHQTWHVKNFEHMAIAYAPSRMLDENKTFQEILFNVIHFATYFILSNHKRFLKEDKFPFMDRAVGLQHPIGPVSSARKIQLVLDKTIVESFSSHTAVSIPLVESKTERMVYEAQNYGEFINNLISVIEMILMRFISISPSDKTGTGTGAGAGVGGFNFICEASDVQSIVCGYQDNITSDRDNIAWLVFDKNELKSLVDRYLGIINSNESDQNIVLDWKCKPTTTAKWTDLMRTCNTICDQFTNAFSRTSNGPVPAFQIYKSSCSLLASLLTDPPTFIKKEAGLEYKRQNPIEWPQRSAKIFPRVIFDEGDRFEFNRTEAGNQLVYFESKTFSATHIEIDSDEEEDENEDEDEVDQALGLQPMFQSKKRRLKSRLEGKDTLPEQIPITDSLEKYSLRLRNTQTRMDMSIVDQKTEFDYPKYQARDIINQTIATDPLFFKHPTKNIMPELAPRAIQAKHYLFATLTALVARYCIPGDISKRGLKSTKPSIAFGLYTLISNYQRVSNQDTFLTTKKNVSQQKQKQKQKRGRKPKSSLANLLDLDTSSADNVDVDVDADVDDTSNFGDVNEDEENLPADIKQLSLKKTLEQIAGRRLDSLITTSLELLRAVVSADMNGSLEQFKSSSKKNNNKGEEEDDENDDDDTATATKTAEQNGKDEKDEKHSAIQNSPGKKRKQPPVDLETETTQESKVGTTTTISTPPKKKNRYNDTPPSSPQPSTSVRSSRKRSPSSSDTETDESEVESETESESEDSERNNDDEESDKDSSEDDQDSDTEKIQVKKEASKSVDRKGETKTSTKPKSKSKAQVKATTKATSKEKTFGDEFGFTPQDIASLHIKRKATRNTERGVKTKTGKFEFFKKRIYERMGKIGLDKKKQSTTVIVKLLVQTFTPIHILGVFFYFAYATETKQTVSEDEKKDLLEDLQERLNEIGQELIYGIEEIRKLSVVKKNMTSIFSTPAQIKSAKKLIDGQLLDHFLRLKTLYNHQFEVVRDKLLVEYLSEVDNGQILKSDTVTEWLHSFANKLSPLKDDENYSFISRLITSMALETSKQGIVGNKKYATFSTQFIDLCQQESTGEAMNFLIDLLPTDAQLKRVISRQDAYDICVYQQKWPSVKNEKNEKNEKKKDTDVAMSDVNAEAEAESTAETETETESETQAKKTAQAAKIRLLRAQIMANQMGGPAILEDYISEKNGSLAASEVYFRLFMRTLPDDVKKNKLGNQHNQEEIKKTITAFYTLDLKPDNEKDWSKIADASFMDQVHVFQHDARFWYYQINFRTSEYWTRLVRHGGGRPPDEGRSLDESGPLTTRQIPTDDFKLLSENSDTIKLAEYQKYDLVDVGEPPEDTLRDFIMGTMVLYQLFTNGECSKTFEHWMGFVGNIIGTSEMINHDSAPGSKSGLVFNQPTRNSPFPNNQLVFLWYNRVLPIFKVVEEQLSNTNVNAPHEKARNQVYRQYLSERVCHIIFSELPYSERFNPEGTSTENNMYRRYLLAIGSYKKTKALAKARWAEAEAKAKEKLRTKIKSKKERARKSVKSSKSASSSSKEEKNENDEKDSDEGDVNMLAAKSSIVDRKDRDQLRDEENIKYSRNAARLFSYILPLESGKTEVDDNTMSSFFQNDLLNLTKIALKNKTIPTMPGENGRERWTRGYFPSIFLTYFSLVFRRVLRSRQFLSLIQGTDPEFQKLATGNPFQIERGKLFLQEKAPESGPVRKFDQSVQNDLLDAVIRYKGGEVKQTLSDVQPQLSTIEQLRAVESSAAVVLSRSSTTTKGSSAALKKPPSGLVSGSGSGSGSGSTSVSRPPTSASTFVNASASIYNVGASTANRALFKNSITPLKSSSTRPASLVSTTTERKVPTERKAGATNASTNAVLSAVLNAKQPNPTDLPVASAIFSASFADRAKQADQINASLQQYLKKNQSRVNQGSF